jgi:hypothetical protein
VAPLIDLDSIRIRAAIAGEQHARDVETLLTQLQLRNVEVERLRFELSVTEYELEMANADAKRWHERQRMTQ